MCPFAIPNTSFLWDQWLFKPSPSRKSTDTRDMIGGIFIEHNLQKYISPYFHTTGAHRLWAAPTCGEREMDEQGKPWMPSSSSSGRNRSDQMSERITNIQSRTEQSWGMEKGCTQGQKSWPTQRDRFTKGILSFMPVALHRGKGVFFLPEKQLFQYSSPLIILRNGRDYIKGDSFLDIFLLYLPSCSSLCSCWSSIFLSKFTTSSKSRKVPPLKWLEAFHETDCMQNLL